MKHLQTYKEQNKFCNESLRDKMTAKTEEEIKIASQHDGFEISETDDRYTEKQVKHIIKKFNKKLNPTFKDDTERRVVDWIYEWESNSISLTLHRKNNYYISFYDSREYSWKKIKTNIFSSNMNFGKFQFRKMFYLLDNALKFLQDCNIDTSGITKQ